MAAAAVLIALLLFQGARDESLRIHRAAAEAVTVLDRAALRTEATLTVREKTSISGSEDEASLRLATLRTALTPMTEGAIARYLREDPVTAEPASVVVGLGSTMLQVQGMPEAAMATDLRRATAKLADGINSRQLMAYATLRAETRRGSLLVTGLGLTMAVLLLAMFLALRHLRRKMRDTNNQSRTLQRELTRAAKAARRSDREKVTYLATMGREIRTPLKSIVGSAELLSGTPLDVDQERFVGSLQERAESLLAIVDDMLALADLESGTATQNVEMLKPSGPIRRAIALSEDDIKGRNLDLETALSPDMDRRVFIDGARLTQVLVHLLGNAAKFTEAGTIRLEARLRPGTGPAGIASATAAAGAAADPAQTAGGRPEPQATSRLEVIVSDTGIGIPADRLTDLFRPFTRIPMTHSGQGERSDQRGGGLGLAVCHRQVSLMGGEIAVRSRLGAGSSFRILLPVTEVDAPLLSTVGAGTDTPAHRPLPPLDRPQQRPPVGSAERSLGLQSSLSEKARSGPLRILVAIAEAPARQDAIAAVEALGHAAESVEDLNEMLNALGADRPDLLLLAENFPEGGTDSQAVVACQKVRALGSQGGHLPIILAGTPRSEDDRATLTSLGVSDWVSNPVTGTALDRALDALTALDPLPSEDSPDEESAADGTGEEEEPGATAPSSPSDRAPEAEADIPTARDDEAPTETNRAPDLEPQTEPVLAEDPAAPEQDKLSETRHSS